MSWRVYPGIVLYIIIENVYKSHFITMQHYRKFQTTDASNHFLITWNVIFVTFANKEIDLRTEYLFKLNSNAKNYILLYCV